MSFDLHANGFSDYPVNPCPGSLVQFVRQKQLHMSRISVALLLRCRCLPIRLCSEPEVMLEILAQLRRHTLKLCCVRSLAGNAPRRHKRCEQWICWSLRATVVGICHCFTIRPSQGRVDALMPVEMINRVQARQDIDVVHQSIRGESDHLYMNVRER